MARNPGRRKTRFQNAGVEFIDEMEAVLACWGIPPRNAAELAIDQINAGGGVGGRKLRLLIEDDRCRPADGVFAFNSIMAAAVPPTMSIGMVSWLRRSSSASSPMVHAHCDNCVLFWNDALFWNGVVTFYLLLGMICCGKIALRGQGTLPLVPALRSTNSAADRSALFVGFTATMVWQGQTSRVRPSSASAPRLPDADRPSHAMLPARHETSQLPMRSLCT
jgi:hypothetical protein